MTKKDKKSHPVSAICSTLGTVLLILIIALCIPIILPQTLGYDVYAVISGSMEPAIPTGSLVIIEATEPSGIESGDVIAYHGGLDSNAIITHRVVENRVIMGEMITKGDANAEIDMHPIGYHEFIGKVIFSLPEFGELAQILTSVAGKITAACIIIAALLLHVLANIFAKNVNSEQ